MDGWIGGRRSSWFTWDKDLTQLPCLPKTHLLRQVVLVEVPSKVELVFYRDGDIEELAEGEVGLDEGQVGRRGRVHGHAGILLAVLLLLHLVSFSKSLKFIKDE